MPLDSTNQRETDDCTGAKPDSTQGPRRGQLGQKAALSTLRIADPPTPVSPRPGA